MKGKLNGISLFTGYGGIDLALSNYVRPLIYCEIERYAQAIILSRMDEGSLEFAPIWNDVTTLNGELFKGLVDIVYGGFPCQDISVAGKGAGLEGERSGLFREIIRICKEASPTFIFLENVPAIRTRGSIEVQEALASIGYDSRWGTLSAAEVGANHKRERWFCLATNTKISNDWKHNSPKSIGQIQQPRKRTKQTDVSDSNEARLQKTRPELKSTGTQQHGTLHPSWWTIEPDVGGLLLDGTSPKLGEKLSETMLNMWKIIGTKAIWDEAGRFYYLSKKEVLRPFMYGKGSSKGISIEISDTKEGLEIQGEILRAMRIREQSLHTPHRWELEEQQYKEFENAVFCLSYIFASQSGRLSKKESEEALLYLWSGLLSVKSMLNPSHSIKEAWESLDSAWRKSLFMSPWNVEPPISRTCESRTILNRVDRIKALGNGVVPLQVKTAFEILMGMER